MIKGVLQLAGNCWYCFSPGPPRQLPCTRNRWIGNNSWEYNYSHPDLIWSDHIFNQRDIQRIFSPTWACSKQQNGEEHDLGEYFPWSLINSLLYTQHRTVRWGKVHMKCWETDMTVSPLCFPADVSHIYFKSTEDPFPICLYGFTLITKLKTPVLKRSLSVFAIDVTVTVRC